MFGLEGPAAVAQFVQRARTYRARVSPRWDLAYGYPRGTVTAGLHAGVAACEWHLHTWDLACSRGRDHRPRPRRCTEPLRRVWPQPGGPGGLAARPVFLEPAFARGRRSSGAQHQPRGRRRLTLAPADAPQDVRAASPGPQAFERALRLAQEPATAASDRLPVTGRAPLHGATGMADPAYRRSAVTAFLWFVSVPRSGLLAPADGGIGLAADHHGVGQAADPLGHLATAMRTNGHDPPSVNPRSDHPRRSRAPAWMADAAPAGCPTLRP